MFRKWHFARLLCRTIRGRNAGTPGDGATRLLVLCFVCLFFFLGRRCEAEKRMRPNDILSVSQTTVDNSSRIIYNQPLRVLSHTISLCPHWLHYFSQIIIILAIILQVIFRRLCPVSITSSHFFSLSPLHSLNTRQRIHLTPYQTHLNKANMAPMLATHHPPKIQSVRMYTSME